MAEQNYLPRHAERNYDRARSNPIRDCYLQSGHNAMPPRGDSRLDAPPPPVPYPNLHMRSNSHQTSNTPANHATIMPRSNRDHASSSSFSFHPEYPNYYPTVHQTSNEQFRYFSSDYNESGSSYPPPHVPHDVTDNRGTSKRKHHDVPVGPIRIEHRSSESGTSEMARTWGSDPAEGSERNVRSRQSHSSPLELNLPRHTVSNSVTPRHFFAHSNGHGSRGPEHANYSAHVVPQDRNMSDLGRYNYDLSNGYHARNHVAHYNPVVRCEPNHHAQNRSSIVPATSHQGTMAHAGGHATTGFPPIAAVHHGPIPAYATTSASARWRQGFTELEASSSHSRPRVSDAGLHSSFRVPHDPSRWLFEHFASTGDPLIFDARDLFDEHRDMRLDIDDMSYEELLALEERIGYVSTGLPDDRISECLMEITCCIEGQGDSCVICMEEYDKGEKVAVLRCTHDFHTTCIKKWLQMKSTCPVCKSEAFEDE